MSALAPVDAFSVPPDIDRIATDIVRAEYGADADWQWETWKAIAEALRAEREQAHIWYPMSVAPTDGTRILLARLSKTDRELKRSVVIGRHADIGGDKTWICETTTYHRSRDFIGWRPLPVIEFGSRAETHNSHHVGRVSDAQCQGAVAAQAPNPHLPSGAAACAADTPEGTLLPPSGEPIIVMTHSNIAGAA